MENFYEEHEIPSSKRAKFMVQEASAVSIDNSFSATNGNSPLGLKLRKSPSLLDLAQLSLSCLKNQENLGYVHTVRSIQEAGEVGEIENRRCAVVHTNFLHKKKATNFSASILRIGSWKCASRYEGDLVVKCYFAKRKLLWEVLESGLKSKIEVQWSDITGLKATCPENKPATLIIELSRSPVFFKESNPLPRKHTIWQATSDFTGGQATIYKSEQLPLLFSELTEKLVINSYFNLEGQVSRFQKVRRYEGAESSFTSPMNI